jgi:hypothetical protein
MVNWSMAVFVEHASPTAAEKRRATPPVNEPMHTSTEHHLATRSSHPRPVETFTWSAPPRTPARVIVLRISSRLHTSDTAGSDAARVDQPPMPRRLDSGHPSGVSNRSSDRQRRPRHVRHGPRQSSRPRCQVSPSSVSATSTPSGVLTTSRHASSAAPSAPSALNRCGTRPCSDRSSGKARSSRCKSSVSDSPFS